MGLLAVRAAAQKRGRATEEAAAVEEAAAAPPHAPRAAAAAAAVRAGGAAFPGHASRSTCPPLPDEREAEQPSRGEVFDPSVPECD